MTTTGSFNRAFNHVDLMLKTLQKQRDEGLGWRIDGVDDWTTEALFEKLRGIGVDTDAARFHDQAVKAGDLKTLDDEWDRQVMESEQGDPGLWRDLILLALPVLWRRLAPDVKCWQLFERPLHYAMSNAERAGPNIDFSKSPEVIAALEAALDYLDSLPQDQRRREFEAMCRIYYSYDDIMLLIARDTLPGNPAFAQRVLEFLEDYGDDEVSAQVMLLSAALMAITGHRDEALPQIKLALAKAGHNVNVVLQAGYVMRDCGQPDEAIRLCQQALTMPHAEQIYNGIMDVLEPLMREAGRENELANLQTRYRPAPAPKAEDAGLFPERTLPPIRVEAKVGRNDPCPCGSGKKYKKCCLK